MQTLVIAPLIFFFASLSAFAGDAHTKPSSAEESVRVLRDPWGVPHVIADSDYGAGYGYGWALSEDRLKEALSGYWTVQGRRTEIEGEDALGIDRTFRLLQLTKHAEDAFAEYPAIVREVATGFADGVNDYMHSPRVAARARANDRLLAPFALSKRPGKKDRAKDRDPFHRHGP